MSTIPPRRHADLTTGLGSGQPWIQQWLRRCRRMRYEDQMFSLAFTRISPASPTTAAALQPSSQPPPLRPATIWLPPPDDLAELTAKLDLKNAVNVGHSTGGGEVEQLHWRKEVQSRVANSCANRRPYRR